MSKCSLTSLEAKLAKKLKNSWTPQNLLAPYLPTMSCQCGPSESLLHSLRQTLTLNVFGELSKQQKKYKEHWTFYCNLLKVFYWNIVVLFFIFIFSFLYASKLLPTAIDWHLSGKYCCISISFFAFWLNFKSWQTACQSQLSIAY